MIGPKVDLTYDYEHLGNDVELINEIKSKSHRFWKTLSSAKRPMIIIGAEQLKRPDGGVLLTSVQSLCEELGKTVGVIILVKLFNFFFSVNQFNDFVFVL